MSVSLLLVPLALAVATSVGGIGVGGTIAAAVGDDADDETVDTQTEAEHPDPPARVSVRTRMKDATLLGAALEDLGGHDVVVGTQRTSAVVGRWTLTMTRPSDDGIWTAHVTARGAAPTQAEATALLARLDTAYAKRVQQAVAERIRSRAGAAGFTLAQERHGDDDTITMVLTVKDRV